MLIAEATTVYVPNWAVLFPVVTGFLAVWYLLPTPRRQPLVLGALGVVAAVVGFGTFLFQGLGGDLPFNVEVFLFGSFALMAFAFGILMIVQRNPARSALYFAVVVLSVCGLFLLLAAPFLMAATIIIYAGAIVVTFLFVIMLAQQRGSSDADDRSREPSLAAAVGFVLLGALLVVLQRVGSMREVDDLIRRSERYSLATSLDEDLKDPARARAYLSDVRRVRERLGYGSIDFPDREGGSDPLVDLEVELNLVPPVIPPMSSREPPVDLDRVKGSVATVWYHLSYLKAVREGRLGAPGEGLPLSPHGQAQPGKPASSDPNRAEPKRLPNANIAALGRLLFTDHLLAVELGGTLLLVATIGAIAISGGRQEKAV